MPRAEAFAPEVPETALRPLLLATVGAGVLSLGLLQFLSDVLPLLDGEGRLLVARGIRTAFFAFIGSSAALLVAYLTGVWHSSRLALAFNLYGAMAFVFGAIIAGGMIGGALKMLANEGPAMPAPVAMFFLFNFVAVVLLAAAAVITLARRANANVKSVRATRELGK